MSCHYILYFSTFKLTIKLKCPSLTTQWNTLTEKLLFILFYCVLFIISSHIDWNWNKQQKNLSEVSNKTFLRWWSFIRHLTTPKQRLGQNMLDVISRLGIKLSIFNGTPFPPFSSELKTHTKGTEFYDHVDLNIFNVFSILHSFPLL